MINKQRVQRIRTVIYVLIVLVIFIPVILVITLSVRLLSVLSSIDAYFAQEAPAITQTAPDALAPPDMEQSEEQDSGYVIEPEGQTLKPEDVEDETPTIRDEEAPLAANNGEPSGSTGPGGDEPETNDGEYVQNTYSPTSFPELYFEEIPVPTTESPTSSAASTGRGTIYLTVDNTPSFQSDLLLDVLRKHKVNATFFVWWNSSLGERNIGFYRTLINEGHCIGIHSASNVESFSRLYASTDQFLSGYDEFFQLLETETGVRPRFYRLPGGSVSPGNPSRQAVLTNIKSELDSRGFLQYDWNASAQDAVSPALDKEQILRNINQSLSDTGHVVVLLHDGTGSSSTADALDQFIAACKADGHQFGILQPDLKPVSFLDHKEDVNQ